VEFDGKVKHPAVLQLRGNLRNEIIGVLRKRDWECEILKTKHGIDIYFSDVNDARRYISMIKRLQNFQIKMSTKYAGLRKGRVRVLFVYSLRFDEI
jgi:NMD protein affecting ribosome stability and mRNA decay